MKSSQTRKQKVLKLKKDCQILESNINVLIKYKNGVTSEIEKLEKKKERLENDVKLFQDFLLYCEKKNKNFFNEIEEDFSK